MEGSGESLASGPGEWLLEQLLAEAHTAAPLHLPVLVNRWGAAIGLEQIVVYLVDIQQRQLFPLTEGLPDLDVDSSAAGSAYRALSLRIEENCPAASRPGCLWSTAPSA